MPQSKLYLYTTNINNNNNNSNNPLIQKIKVSSRSSVRAFVCVRVQICFPWSYIDHPLILSERAFAKDVQGVFIRTIWLMWKWNLLPVHTALFWLRKVLYGLTKPKQVQTITKSMRWGEGVLWKFERPMHTSDSFTVWLNSYVWMNHENKTIFARRFFANTF